MTGEGVVSELGWCWPPILVLSLTDLDALGVVRCCCGAAGEETSLQ